jgi:hypothetical protein
MRKVKSSRFVALARSSQTTAANTAEMAVITVSAARRNFRRSTVSASAPAGNANRNIGSDVATCTIDTMNGSGLRLVMSHPEAALYIQLPTLETTVAVQRTAKAG